ncbi:DUF4826 family protein [Thiospirochaeta perfilievii]|uniref:DUF4826 family protein n=1 Tax=Thiospirochaeta perfilievii TaxID=252967 RepID=A0A5C1QB53_9SPIO|nr:DUF4826 family protein [Thiospirochaeta perfilievii]QEN04598.1 DUF4826 family protein [Thiospirochaeta perfilievii]
MLSKNETFKPPTKSEEWANAEFANVLDYMCEQDVNFDGSIFLQWLAVPYISIWFARVSNNNNVKVWIIHNLEFSDHIVSSDIKTSRDAIILFSTKWISQDESNLRVRNNNRSKLKSFGSMLLNVGCDDELWKDHEYCI